MNRKEAKAAGLTKYIGSVCKKHPELNGSRKISNGNCCACQKQMSKAWKINNPGAAKKSAKESRIRNLDSIKEGQKLWRINNKEYQLKRVREWNAKNPWKRNSTLALYRAALIKATPKWANTFFINEAYKLAKLREKLVGGKWHVSPKEKI